MINTGLPAFCRICVSGLNTEKFQMKLSKSFPQLAWWKGTEKSYFNLHLAMEEVDGVVLKCQANSLFPSIAKRFVHFLTEEFKQGWQHSMMNSYQSALSATLSSNEWLFSWESPNCVQVIARDACSIKDPLLLNTIVFGVVWVQFYSCTNEQL